MIQSFTLKNIIPQMYIYERYTSSGRIKHKNIHILKNKILLSLDLLRNHCITFKK